MSEIVHLSSALPLVPILRSVHYIIGCCQRVICFQATKPKAFQESALMHQRSSIHQQCSLMKEALFINANQSCRAILLEALLRFALQNSLMDAKTVT